MTLRRACGPYNLMKLYSDMAYGLNLMVDLLLKERLRAQGKSELEAVLAYREGPHAYRRTTWPKPASLFRNSKSSVCW